MAYTQEEHNKQLDLHQSLLDELNRVVTEAGFDYNTNEVLVGSLPEGTSITIAHTCPFPKGRNVSARDMRFYSVDMRTQVGTIHLLNIQFGHRSGKVHDSARFDENGEYQGWGHIQCWYEPWPLTRESYLDTVRDSIKRATSWHKEPSPDYY